jgi:hypothetical protein
MNDIYDQHQRNIRLITHPAHLAGVASSIEAAVRVVGLAFGELGDSTEKYGCDYENDIFMIHRYCWCEKNDDSCLWCMHGDHPDFDRLLNLKFGTIDYQKYRCRHYYDPPNFWFKPTDFRLTWYKYIGRDMASNKDEIPSDFLHQIFATHPDGMTLDRAIALFAERLLKIMEYDAF